LPGSSANGQLASALSQSGPTASMRLDMIRLLDFFKFIFIFEDLQQKLLLI